MMLIIGWRLILLCPRANRRRSTALSIRLCGVSSRPAMESIVHSAMWMSRRRLRVDHRTITTLSIRLCGKASGTTEEVVHVLIMTFRKNS